MGRKISTNEFAYGEEANTFLKETLVNIPKGKILFPADEEGRNGVYAALLMIRKLKSIARKNIY